MILQMQYLLGAGVHLPNKNLVHDMKFSCFNALHDYVSSLYGTMLKSIACGFFKIFESYMLIVLLILFLFLAGDVAFRILDSINSIKRRALLNVLEDDLQEETKVYVCDINPNMLNVGKKRALQRGNNVINLELGWIGHSLIHVIKYTSFECKIGVLKCIGLGEDKSLLWVEGDAEALSFGDNTMDGYTIAFGIRNVTHIEKALSEAYRYGTQLCAV